jgi:outer membrane autotransporter protein
MDVGCDRVLSYDDGDTWIGGAFAGYGGAVRSFNDFGSRGLTHTPYAGLYATWFNENRYYADFTAKVHRFQNAFDAQDGSGNIHSGQYSNWAYGGSAEFGRRFDMGGGWILQPQGQIQYVHVTGNSYTTQRGISVSASPDNVWQLRGGLEFGQLVSGSGASNTYYYGRASVIEQLSAGGVITTDALVWDPDLDGLQLEFGTGVIHQFDDSRQGYLAILASIGQAFNVPWAINGGYRVEF